MTKDIDTLIDDIHGIFLEPSHKITEENLDMLCEDIKAAMRKQLEESKLIEAPRLRGSNIGRPARQLWYDFHTHDPKNEGKPAASLDDEHPSKYLRFLDGDIAEAVMMFLAREAGHKVELVQHDVECEHTGVKGSLDCFIDDWLTDIKTASDYSYTAKFKNQGLLKGPQEDPFGYVPQISFYDDKTNFKRDKKGVAFWAKNKNNSRMTVLKVPEFNKVDSKKRIEHLQEVVESPTPPKQKCYDPVPVDKKKPEGNQILPSNCAFCKYKFDCWKDSNNGRGLQVYDYASGPTKYFTEDSKAGIRVANITEEFKK